MHALIVFGPLIGAAVAGLFQRFIGDRAAMLLTSGLVVLSAVLSTIVFAQVAFGGEERIIVLMRWFAVGTFETSWSLRIDTLSAVMLVVVTYVSSLVHIYSIGYMAEDPHRARFFSYLSLFTFAMLMLVTADDFLQLFFGWEGVGLASYLLIGFWYKNPAPNAAAIKAFVVNRVGDFGFALGIMAVYLIFGTLEFDAVFAMVPEVAARSTEFLGMSFNAIELIAVLLFIGAMGKSAQFILHVWLPDAMEGPTPVSALIHAATMVTAGVFLVCRASPIYEAAPIASMIVVVVGAVTAFFAATVGLVQNDIKRVIAYSTCSQLGYMFFAAGLGLYGAAMFHLFTHAFFKALLFLGAGSVIHALHHEQDMRNMGGVWKKIPYTWALMIIGTLALTGVGLPMLGIGFAGFFSKDAIIEGAWDVAHATGSNVAMLAFWTGVIAALLTSFYSWRLIFLTFHGKYRGDHHTYDHAHESPKVMMIPLVLLAIGAVLAGSLFVRYFVGSAGEGFWREAMVIPEYHGHDHIPLWVLWAPFAVTLAGLLGAMLVYLTRAGEGLRDSAKKTPLHAFLYNKWYFDELYHAVFVRGARALGDIFWKIGDVRIIDGLGPNGIARAAKAGAARLSRLQTGYLYHYALVMLAALVIAITALIALRGA